MNQKIGFIGAGNMGGALITAACRGNNPADVVITDVNPQKAHALADSLGCSVLLTNAEIVRSARMILLAVIPQVLEEVVRGIAPVLREECAKGEEKILISMAAGVTVQTIKGYLDGLQLPVIRIMPNTPAAVGKGIILVTSDERCPDEIPEKVYSDFAMMMRAAGAFDRLPESMIDKAMIATGCTPAFAYMFIEALADGAVMTGLPRDKAIQYSAQALLGAAAMVLESGLHPEQLKDNVCSPGGSTIVGVAALEKGGMRSAAIEAMRGAYSKHAGEK